MQSTFTNAKWSAHAKDYQSVFGAVTARWATDSLQAAHHKILPLLTNTPEPVHFVDIGCGPGVLTFEFMRRYLTATTSNFRITATDLSDGMLQQLNETLQEDPGLNAFRDKVSTVQMDGMVLDKLETGTVDVVGSNFALGIFPTRSRGWEAARRVLKDDGVLFATAWDVKTTQFHWFDGIAELYNAAGGDGEPMPVPSQAIGTDMQSIAKELQAAGFKDVTVYSTTHTVVLDDPEAFLQTNMSNPMTGKFLERLTSEQLETALVKLIEKDAKENCYETESTPSATDAKSFMDGRPRAIPFTALSVVARK